jgi:MFS family permease
MIPASVALIVANYEDEGRRGQAFSIYGMGGMVAGLLAPTFMGFMAEHVSWRVPYGIEIPIILVAIVLARRMRETPTVKTSVDAPGTVLTFLAIGAIVMSGMLGARYGWWDARRPFEILGVGFNPLDLAPTAILLIAAVVLLAILVAHVRRREDRGQPALFRMSLFDNHTYLVSFVLCAVFFLLNGALPFVVPVFLQEGVRFDASQAGMVMTVFMVGALFGSLASGPLVARIQPRTLMQLALAVVGVGFFALYATSSTTMGFAGAAIPMFIVGFGFGIVVAQAPNVQLSTVAPELQGEASGLAETSKEVGVGLGTAVIGSILFSFALGNMVDGVAQQAEVDLTMKERSELILQVEDKSVPEDVKKLVDETVPDLEEVIKEAYLKAFKSTLGVLVAVVLLAFLIASFIPRVGKEAMEKAKPHTAAVSSVGG